MRSLTNYSKLCVHTQTNKPWTIEECITQYAAAGISAISIWRHLLEGKDLSEIKELLIKNEMEVVALVRGGFFPFR
jgi:sugar phosphate isomerase/epimerase